MSLNYEVGDIVWVLDVSGCSFLSNHCVGDKGTIVDIRDDGREDPYIVKIQGKILSQLYPEEHITSTPPEGVL
jgi:hypothetical protein